MALDSALLGVAAEGDVGARVYSWDGVWVTVGSMQRPEEVLIDLATPHIVRPTGGGAVLHGHDVTVAIGFPKEALADCGGMVRGTYRAATRPLILALQACGVEATLAEDAGVVDRAPRRIDCFSGSSANDIVHASSRRKICGCALRRTRDAVLLHASIPVREPSVPASQLIWGGVAVEPVHLDKERFAQELRAALS